MDFSYFNLYARFQFRMEILLDKLPPLPLNCKMHYAFIIRCSISNFTDFIIRYSISNFTNSGDK